MSSYRKKHNTPKPAKPKPAAQPEPEYNNPGVERSIHTDRLTSGLPYQRPVNPKEVERLIQEWDERLLDPITVSFRDGKFYVVDGQHRISAMREMNGGRGIMVNCKVYNGLTYEQEADLCYKLDKAKKRLSLSQSTNVLAESGGDAEIRKANTCALSRFMAINGHRPRKIALKLTGRPLVLCGASSRWPWRAWNRRRLRSG